VATTSDPCREWFALCSSGLINRKHLSDRSPQWRFDESPGLLESELTGSKDDPVKQIEVIREKVGRILPLGVKLPLKRFLFGTLRLKTSVPAIVDAIPPPQPITAKDLDALSGLLKNKLSQLADRKIQVSIIIPVFNKI